MPGPLPVELDSGVSGNSRNSLSANLKRHGAAKPAAPPRDRDADDEYDSELDDPLPSPVKLSSYGTHRSTK